MISIRDRPFPFPRLVAVGRTLVLGIAASMLATMPAHAAETVRFRFWLLERSVTVDSLEAFADEGTVNSDLAFFLEFIDDTQAADFRNALTVSNTLNPVAVAQTFYDPMGEQSLRFLGNVIQTGGRQNGLYALRAALIQSADQPNGFTILDMLRNFPTDEVLLDLDVALRGVRRADNFFRQTDRVIAGLQSLSEATAAAEPPLALAELPDLTEPGPYAVSQQTLVMVDEEHDRTYPVDLYLPAIANAAPGSIPVVILSHGFGSQRSDFVDIAEYFASYGFALVVPEHIDSNKAQQEAVLAGQASEFFRASEFVNRPLDISYLLDDLERRNGSEFQGQLKLDQVAAIGHSFGGYTVLALGGATVDLPHAHEMCEQDSFVDFLNPALLLQCRVLELESSSGMAQQLAQGLRDERVSFVIAVNPVNRIVFGPQGIRQLQVPVVIMGGGYDVAAPLVPEQAYAFTQIPSEDKYLLLIEGQAHGQAISALVNRVLSPSLDEEQLMQGLQLLRSNSLAVIQAFLQVYLADRPEYRPMLQASYMAQLNEPPFEFNLVRSLTEEQLRQMLQGTFRDGL